MDFNWQHIVVWGLLAISAVVVIYSAIAGWRNAQKGKCGGCAKCGDSEKPERRVVFMPAENLRSSRK